MSQQNDYIIYKVEEGDTVFSIAQKYYGNGNDKVFILEANRLFNNKVRPGMKIKLPYGKDIYERIFR